MYIFVQKTGELFKENGELIGIGYSGYNEGKNNPKMQDVKNIGPIPCGNYTIANFENSPKLGPVAFPLWPSKKNEMFGRGDFFIHADSIHNPGKASEGCIVMGPSIRQEIANNLAKENHLLVIPFVGEPEEVKQPETKQPETTTETQKTEETKQPEETKNEEEKQPEEEGTQSIPQSESD